MSYKTNCYFCGVEIEFNVYGPTLKQAHIKCKNCGFGFVVLINKKSSRGDQDEWNKRRALIKLKKLLETKKKTVCILSKVKKSLINKLIVEEL